MDMIINLLCVVIAILPAVAIVKAIKEDRSFESEFIKQTLRAINNWRKTDFRNQEFAQAKANAIYNSLTPVRQVKLRHLEVLNRMEQRRARFEAEALDEAVSFSPVSWSDEEKKLKETLIDLQNDQMKGIEERIKAYSQDLQIALKKQEPLWNLHDKSETEVYFEEFYCCR